MQKSVLEEKLEAFLENTERGGKGTGYPDDR